MKAFHELPLAVQDEIRQLIQCGCYRSAADLAREHGATALDPELDV